MIPKELVAIIKSIKVDAQRLKTLSNLLEKQYVALSARKTDQLDSINSTALDLIDSICKSQHNRERELCEVFNRPEGDKALFQLFINKLPEQLQDVTTKLVDEFETYNRLCQIKNERNGLLLASQRELMQSLTGVTTHNSYPQALVKM